MRWSFKIATIFGIPIRLHVTFLLLLGLIAIAGPRSQGSIPGGLMGVILVGAVFLCVLLHELGHSIVARRFGVIVDSITLLPIGGVAAMRTLPRSARGELLIALAGPAVSLALGLLLAGLSYLWYGVGVYEALGKRYLAAPMLLQLATINIVLAAFNLLPAFPMDGGRILRASLWSRVGFARATTVAANIGQGLAITLFFLAILKGHVVLVIIALFIYFGAEAEGRTAVLRDAFAHVPAEDAMLTNLEYIGPQESIEQVSQRMIHTGQDNFPIFQDGVFLGMLTRRHLLRALRERKHNDPAERFMTREIVFCSPVDSLASVVHAMNARDLPCVAVIVGDQLVGLITPEQIGKFGMLTKPQRTAERYTLESHNSQKKNDER